LNAYQIEQKCGSQASYRADFYPVCEYLAEISKICALNDSKGWIEAQKSLLKNNGYAVLIENLPTKLKTIKRLSLLVGNCTGAIAKDLPIGSGVMKPPHF
jgi:hypothetical protein